MSPRQRLQADLGLTPDEALALCARLSASLGGYLSPPTSITSVYFDKPGYPLARRSLGTPACSASWSWNTSSSPSTSTVAYFPSAFRLATVCRASSSVGPAM